MRIVTTPMCEEIVRIAGVSNYRVNKNPDLEEGDLAILLSESKVEMKSLPIKLNTPKQVFNSILEVSKITNNELTEKEIFEFFKDYPFCVKYLDDHKNSHVKVKVYSNFLKDIVLNIGFKIVDEDYDYIIYPDYLKDRVSNMGINSIEIPTDNNADKNPFERIEMRYSILEKLI